MSATKRNNTLSSVPEDFRLSFTNGSHGKRRSSADTGESSTTSNTNNNDGNTDFFDNDDSDNILQLDRSDRERAISEIHSIVSRILPEESNNIGEMLEEFRGRELQLLRSLRRMEERHANANANNGGDDDGGAGSGTKGSPGVDPDDFIFDEEDPPSMIGEAAVGEDPLHTTPLSFQDDENDDDNDDVDKINRHKRSQTADTIQITNSSSPSTTTAQPNKENTTKMDFFDRWQQDLEEQLDESSRSGSVSTRGSHPSSNPQGGGEIIAGGGGEELLKTPPEELILMNMNGSTSSNKSNQSVQRRLSGKNEKRRGSGNNNNNSRGAASAMTSNSSNNNNSNRGANSIHNIVEEKKNDSPPSSSRNITNGYQLYAHSQQERERREASAAADEDENDVPPPNDNSNANNTMPDVVRTNSMKQFSLSGLTTQSNFEDHDVDSQHSNSLDDSQRSKSTVSTVGRSRKTVAMVKLRVWDPARPKGRLKVLTATQILLPHQSELDAAELDALGKQSNSSGKMKRRDSREAALQREESENSKNSARSSSRHVKRLSIVKEEPDKPPERGDSYYFDDTSGHNNDGGMGQALKMAASKEEEMNEKEGGDLPSDEEENENDNEGGSGSDSDESTDGRTKLRVGTLIGIQPKTSSSSSSSKQIPGGGSSSIASSYSYQRKGSNRSSIGSEWKVGQSIALHSINLLPISNLSQLHYRIEHDYTSLRELVLDGLPPNAFCMEEYELLFEALGGNTSVKRWSMRYSAVDDELASLFALALVDNTNLTQLYLEGNSMTTVSAKNFYSVLKKNNDTLRLLDLSKNIGIDEDVERALDQFMEQRALKRTLTNKAEKAKRAARGMPPDMTLEEDEDECDGQVTVVCLEGMMEEIYNGDGGKVADVDENDQGNEQSLLSNEYGMQNGFGPGKPPPQPQDVADDASGSTAKPLPGENFRDYMLRMDERKLSNNQNPLYNQKLMNDSIKERQAFDTFEDAPPVSPHPTSMANALSPTSQVPPAPPSPHVVEGGGTDNLGNESTGSSITTRSTTQNRKNDVDVITMSSNNESKKPDPLEESRKPPPPAVAAPAAAAAKSSSKAAAAKANPPPKRMGSLETEASAHDGASGYLTEPSNGEDNGTQKTGKRPTMETLESAGADDDFPEPYPRSGGRYKRSGSLETLESEAAPEFPKAYGRRTATGRRQMMNGLNMSAVTEASADPSPNTSSSILRNPYVNTNASNATLDISEEDYMTEKMDERAIRRQLATEGGAIGAYHIDEAAPSRQNRRAGSGGGGAGDRRRSRMGRSESQRRARLAELEGGGGGAPSNAAIVGGSNNLDDLLDADIERADMTFDRLQRKKSMLSVVGLDDDDAYTDRVVCGFLALLLMAFLVLVVMYLMR